MNKFLFAVITRFLNKKISLISRLKHFFIFTSAVLLISATNRDPKPVIWILGDSTACDVPSDESKPPLYLMGWAQMLQSFFDTNKVIVDNRASPGQSSRSFFSQKWPEFKDKIQKDDYVIIQFGHNDPKSTHDRLTIPGSTYEEYLMKYITHAKNVGAVPILVTSIERNDRWSGNKLSSTHGKYPESMRNLAKKENVSLVDLTQLTNDLFVKLGKKTTTETIFFPNTGSHLQKKGAEAISKLFTDDLVRQKIEPICTWLKESLCTPTSIKVRITDSDTHHNLVAYNSAQKKLYINAIGPQQLFVTVLALNGKTLLSKTFDLRSAGTTMEIPVHDLKQGTYLVKSEFKGISKVDLISIVH